MYLSQNQAKVGLPLGVAATILPLVVAIGNLVSETFVF